MSITGPEELAGMRAAGAIVRRMLEAMKKAVRAGVTTAVRAATGLQVPGGELHQPERRSCAWHPG
jgi:hypothetical protein